MKNTSARVVFCALLLLTALIWRMLGAPIAAEEWENVELSAWQASEHRAHPCTWRLPRQAEPSALRYPERVLLSLLSS